MDINVYNTKLAGMNPAELGMVWMGHFAPDRSMILDDNSGYFGQSTIGLAVMDEITQQTHAMDMNPMMGMINDFQQQSATIGQEQHSIMSPAEYINHMNNQHEQYNLINTNEDEEDDDDNDVDDNNQNIIDNNGGVDDDDECVVGDDDNNDDENCDNENDNNCHIINNDIIYQQQQMQHHQHLQQQQILLQHNLDIDLDQQQQQQLQQQLLLQNNFNDFNNLTLINQQFCTKNATTISTESPETIIKNNLNLYSSNNNSNNNNNNNNSNNNTNNSNNNISIHNKKIRPIKRPGLILKTPIAYQGNIDPSVIPIHRDGMAVCERCGAIGVKHSFYTKERRFCSMTCARGFAYINYKRQIENDEPDINITDMDNKMLNSNKENNDNDIADNNYDDIELDIKKTVVHNPNFRFKMSSRNNFDNNLNNYNNTTTMTASIAQETDLIGTTPAATTDNKLKLLYNDNNINDEDVILPQEDLPQIPKINILQQQHCIQEDKIKTVRRNNKLNDSNLINNSYDWTNILIKFGKTNICAAAVNCFKHAPGYDMWNNIEIGIKVEVENTDCDNTDDILNDTIPHSFWVATVLRICGYKALIRYEGFDTDSSHDFWVNLCSSEVHPVGWCATRGKPLIPPRTIENKYSDWKEFLVKRLSGARTLPSTFYNKINDSFKSRFRCGLILEVVDKLRISTVKVATVNKIIGKRLYVRYYDSDTMNDNGFWCHEDSPLIHPVGWAKTIGHDLDAPKEYIKRFNNINIIENINVHNLTENDTTIDLFKMNFNITEYLHNDYKCYKFVEGMKLEAIDPLNLSTICVATVMAVLKFGYLMIRIDSYDLDESNGDWFCYHEKSPCIFPVGFCKKNQLILTPPKGFEQNTFIWEQYLLDTNSIPATENFFTLNIRHKHNFLPGMKLECADVMDPRLVCVATVSKVVGRLLKISFDGWEEEFDQWLDCDSPDMYPLGWCYLVGHKLEGPRMQTNKKEQINVSKNKKSNNTTSSYKKRKKGPKTSISGNNVPKIQHMTNLRKDKLHQQQQNQQKLQSDLEQRMLDQQNHIYDDPDDDNENEQSSSSKLDYKMAPDDLINSIIDYDVDDVVNDDEIGDYNYDDDEDDGNTTTTSEHMSETSSTTMHDRSSSSTSMYLEKQQGGLLQQQQSQHQRVMSSSSCSSGVGGNSSCSTTAISVNDQLTQKPPTPPPERKATSYINNSTVSNSKYIPRLIDINNLSPIEINKTLGNLVPITWNIYDVAQFLRVNDCTTYCDIFSRNKIDGKKLLQLNKDDIIKLLDMKVGPSIKIYDLIQQLKCKIYKMNNLLSSTVATAVTSPFIISNNNNNNKNKQHFNIINSNSSSNSSISSNSNSSISQNINLKKFL